MRALIAFAKEPVPRRVKTRLAAAIGPAAAARLYRAFVADLSRAWGDLPRTSVTWWVEGDDGWLRELAPVGANFRSQPPGDLGARLNRAFADAFAGGDGPVAAVGTDCPLLRASDLNVLFEAVEEGADAALIPAVDGGYVALALAGPTPGVFDGIPWSTEEVSRATCDALSGAGRSVRVLPARYDVDVFEDLLRLAADLAAEPGIAPRTARVIAEVLAERGRPCVPPWRGSRKHDLGHSSESRQAMRDVPAGQPRRPQEAMGVGDATAVIDDLGRTVPAQPAARRIISLVPSVTECLFDLGAGSRVVGRTDFCVSPPGLVETLPRVGGPKTVRAEAVSALAPDLVLANAEENDRGQVERLIALGLRVHVAFPRTLGQVGRFLADLGMLLGMKAVAVQAAEALLSAGADPPQPPVRAACLVWKDPFMSANADTLTSALLAAAGAENVFAGRGTRYPAVTEADLAAARPAAILLPSEPFEFEEADAAELSCQVPGAQVLRLPGEWVTWYGCRMPEAIRGLRALLAPLRGDETRRVTPG